MKKYLIFTLIAFFALLGQNAGASSFNFLDATASISFDGAVIFNDSSADVDFRVESDDDENAIFVDAGNDRVGIFTAAPTVAFDVTGVSLFTGAMTIEGAVTINDTSADVDFRVESNGDTDAIFVDAGNDRVGIFTAAPTVAFEVTGDTFLSGAIKLEACTIADGDATPDVAGCTVLTTSANTGATEITDLDNPVVNAIYVIIGGSATNSSTITDGGNFALSAGFTASVDEVLILYVQADNDYIELARSTN